jgi:hypothetical protein
MCCSLTIFTTHQLASMSDTNHHNESPEERNKEEIDLNLENELLKIKLQAEMGAQFESFENVPPELENLFLQNIQQFEEAWKNAKTEKVYDLVGRPTFTSVDDLSEEEVSFELERLLDIMRDHSIELDVLGTYPATVIYRFVTEELFEHETTGMEIPGMTAHYIYEEFHPNHQLDIEEVAKRFLNNWFDMHFGENTDLASSILVSSDVEIPRELALKKMQNFFDCFQRFDEFNYQILEIAFQWNDETSTGLGHAEGTVSYTAELESGEETRIEGPFKLYMANEFGAWNVFNFVFPGFQLQ